MRKLIVLSVYAVVGLICDSGVLAQQPPKATPPTGSTAPQNEVKQSGNQHISDRPVIIPPEAARNPSLPDHPQRPSKAANPPPSSSVKTLVHDFQSARQAFLLTEQQLRRQLKEASQEQRAAIRAQLKENLANWLAEQRSRVQELRDQARDIKDKVPSIKDVVDSAGGEGRGR